MYGRKDNSMDKVLAGQVQTERGLINIEGAYMSSEKAEMDGYRYAFHSNKLGVDLYSSSLDERGLRHSFVYIDK